MAEEPLDTCWLDTLAESVGVADAFGSDGLTAAVADALLSIAGDAARDSGDRRNAPISCFLVGVALGRSNSAITADAIRVITGN